MDINIQKIRNLCGDELAVAASTGKVNPAGKLHSILRTLSIVTLLDTQAVEELNSLISVQSRRCRNMSNELLSARVCAKKTLCPSRDLRARFATLKPMATALHKLCMAGMPGASRVLGQANRFTLTEADRCELPTIDKRALVLHASRWLCVASQSQLLLLDVSGKISSLL
jgi:hypothetical protein